MAIDLPDAIFEQLRSGIQVTRAFGDTWDAQAGTGVSKFFADYAPQVEEPFLVLFEPGEAYEYMTRADAGIVNYLATGQLQIFVVDGSRFHARQLGEVVIAALEDQLIAWPGTEPMNLRIARAAFVPKQGIGPGQPTVFQRALTFDYQYSGQRPSGASI